MAFEIIAIISGILIIVIVFILISLARSVLSEVPDDTSSGIHGVDSSRGIGSLFSRFWSWLNRSQLLLDYRRDKRGRFRKVRRG